MGKQINLGCHGHGFAWPCGPLSAKPCPRKAVGMAPNLKNQLARLRRLPIYCPHGLKSSPDMTLIK